RHARPARQGEARGGGRDRRRAQAASAVRRRGEADPRLGAACHARGARGARRSGQAGAGAPSGARRAGGHAGEHLARPGRETEKLKASLRQLNEKIEEAKRKRNLLIAKQKRAQAQKRIHETMSGLSDASAFDAFNRMAEKIEESQLRTGALPEVEEAHQLPDVEGEFLQLEASSSAG